jgi:hypothetical protein
MHPSAAHALADLQQIADAHRFAHTCTDGVWYNPHAGPRTPCSVTGLVTHLRTEVHRLLTAVPDAAHDPDLIDAVAHRMTGFDLSELPQEEADGWRTTAGNAVEALADLLDLKPEPADDPGQLSPLPL